MGTGCGRSVVTRSDVRAVKLAQGGGSGARNHALAGG